MEEWTITSLSHTSNGEGNDMEFSKFDYALVGIWLPLATTFSVFTVAFLLSRYLAVKKYNWGVIMLLWGMVLIFLLRGLAISAQGLKYPIRAALQQNATQYITVGNVESVQHAPSPPVFFNPDSKQFVPAKFLTVDGMQFYLPIGDVQVGQTIELRWATDNFVVYAYRLLSPEEQFESGTYPIKLPVQTYSNINVGSIITTVSAILFALVIVLQYPLGKVMVPRFVQKDREFQDIIVPNRFGLLYVGIPLLLLCGILGGLAFSGFYATIVVLLIGTVFVGRAMVKKQSTTVTLDKQQLVIRAFRETMCIETDSIEAVEFVASRLPHNRCLVLRLKNGIALRFEQEHFYGLEYMYRKLSSLQE